MELKVGMYIRTKYNDFCNEVAIRKIIEIAEEDNNSFYVDYYIIDILGDEQGKLQIEDVEKASYDIMDLIKVEDYVNGYKVSLKGYDYAPFVQCDYLVENGTTNHYKFYKQAIKSVVTKELFELAEYRIGE